MVLTPSFDSACNPATLASIKSELEADFLHRESEAGGVRKQEGAEDEDKLQAGQVGLSMSEPTAVSHARLVIRDAGLPHRVLAVTRQQRDRDTRRALELENAELRKASEILLQSLDMQKAAVRQAAQRNRALEEDKAAAEAELTECKSLLRLLHDQRAMHEAQLEAQDKTLKYWEEFYAGLSRRARAKAERLSELRQREAVGGFVWAWRDEMRQARRERRRVTERVFGVWAAFTGAVVRLQVLGSLILRALVLRRWRGFMRLQHARYMRRQAAGAVVLGAWKHHVHTESRLVAGQECRRLRRVVARWRFETQRTALVALRQARWLQEKANGVSVVERRGEGDGVARAIVRLGSLLPMVSFGQVFVRWRNVAAARRWQAAWVLRKCTSLVRGRRLSGPFLRWSAHAHVMTHSCCGSRAPFLAWLGWQNGYRTASRSFAAARYHLHHASPSSPSSPQRPPPEPLPRHVLDGHTCNTADHPESASRRTPPRQAPSPNLSQTPSPAQTSSHRHHHWVHGRARSELEPSRAGQKIPRGSTRGKPKVAGKPVGGKLLRRTTVTNSSITSIEPRTSTRVSITKETGKR